MSLYLFSWLSLQIKTENTIAHTVLIIILLITVGLLLHAYLHQIRRNLMIENTEQLRTDFFTKLTHEIRTPLTIILGLSRQLRDQRDYSLNNSKTYLSAIERQGRELSDLVNQLLDAASLKTASQTMEWETGNIVAFVEMISETFTIYAKQKEIELIFFSDEMEIVTDFVPNYLNKILQNLLSNAIRYSNEGSRIFLRLERNKKDRKKLLIKVIDQGKGIKSADLPHIFDMFYKGGATEEKIGNGIGLTLTKQLVEMLDGNIKVESDHEKGSVFTIELPLQINSRKLYSRFIPDKKCHPHAIEGIAWGETMDQFTSKHNDEDPRTIILLVEDNKNVAQYMKALFNEEMYLVIHANNGMKALELANQYLPDIIITDIIMSKIDGIELCREIRASDLLNHIPIIIVSARNTENDLVQALRNGADDYIRKPFLAEELQVRVENLLESRHLLKEKYLRTVLKDEKNEMNNNKNVDFLRHVTDIIYREMNNPEFSSKKLAQELAISTSQLNKKLNATTGYPSSTYILHVKLMHAKKILASKNKSIGEVASECGVYDVNYFSRIFKKHTGVTPTQYQRLPHN